MAIDQIDGSVAIERPKRLTSSQTELVGVKTFRTTAKIVGAVYLAGFVVGLVGSGLFQSILGATGASANLPAVAASSVLLAFGAILWLMAVAGDAAHGVLMFPILRRYHERIALGYLASRIVDAVFIAVMVLFVLVQIPLASAFVKAAVTDASFLQTVSGLFAQGQVYAYDIGMITMSELIATKPTAPKQATNGHPPASSRLNLRRKTSLVAGALYLLIFVSIPTLALYDPVRDPNYIVGPGPDSGVLFGGILELIVALAGIGTAVALYSVVKRQNEGLAMGFVGSRVLEAGTMFAGVACLLSVVTLRQAGAGAEALVIGHALVAMYDRMFLVGQSFIPAVNALLLGSLLYQSRLVPRVLPLLGFIGAALLVAGDIAVLFGLIGQHAPSTALAAIPIALWEFSLGVWLVVKGFTPSPILSGDRDMPA